MLSQNLVLKLLFNLQKLILKKLLHNILKLLRNYRLYNKFEQLKNIITNNINNYYALYRFLTSNQFRKLVINAE